ncbi:protein-methionine sulfoxide oxidase mical2b-like isoform X3 [Takifugu rubripes]|uniref:protein-methionine sulfoxide oxidase mical2b-like isoform X3 n=1 Tax=Takifugu rubripes TaxID=31033 RepID=UPI001145D71F|nr:protein-methionine sulfoxide oxidase mical2b-like isoform X3 [Takifugu rubripes]
MGETEDEHLGQASVLFENFVQASTCKGTLQAFSILCRQLQLDPLDYSNFYSSLKAAVSTWKVKTLWTKLDKKAQQKVYGQNKACQGTRCLIIGGGPCGLRTAIELALLGCKVVLIEKRDTFSRNNVLHLWPFTIHDLRGLGAKKFYGKFCAGSIDHISIRQLQLMLLKVCLILGVEIHVNVEFTGLLEPQKEQPDEESGWRAEFQPSGHPLADFHFDVVIGADGRKSTLDGFARKEFRGKLAIAITANFVNRNTTAEAKVEEISGVAFIFNQKFFLELKEETGIDLENIVYYRDNTHYFVMTAKKQSLLDKGVIISDHIETERLLSADNVNQEALLSYAREAADFGTNYQLPSLDYAINHYGQPDVAMFDFTCMYASENATLIREKRGHQLVVALVGDSLLEPFWPMGTGCARGFLAAFDTAWMVRGWAQGRKPLEILAERESIYRLLPQTTPENISKNFEQYSIDPVTRYPNLNVNYIRPHQVRHLFINGHLASCHLERGGATHRSGNWFKRESDVHPGRLLSWCQKQTRGYRGVVITDLTSSWRNGLALCALIHHQRPELIDFDSLEEEDVAENNQLAFDIAEREFGIQPVIRGEEMAAAAEPDQLLMVLYLSKFQEAFRSSPANGRGSDANIDEYCAKSKPVNPQPRKRIPRDDKKLEDDSVNKRQRKGNHYLTELSCHSALPAGEDGELRENKVRSMATQLLAKFEENSSTVQKRSKYDEESDLSFSSEEEKEEKDNPRFAKPSDAPSPPPFPPSRPRWQPSIYLRLLENPSLVTPQANFLFNAPSPLSESRSPSPSRSESPPCPSVSQQPPPEHASFAPTVSHDSSSIPSSARSMQQKLSSREFSRKSVKERAVLLSTMFAGFTPSHLRSCDSQVLHNRREPALACETGSFLKYNVPLWSHVGRHAGYILSSTCYPAVHPVPDPTVQPAFSSVSLSSAGLKDLIQIESTLSSDSGQTHQTATLPVDSSPNDNKSPPARSSPSPLGDSDAHVGSSSDPSLPHKDSSGRLGGSGPGGPPTAAQETFSNRKLAENGQLKSDGSHSGILPNSAVHSLTAAPSYDRERTVGKVSSAIDAKAQLLAILYETDHRPNAAPCVARKDGAAGLGGSDICHFCSKRVYVMERLSAEGFFFHRECFRCDVCSCTLRLGGHAFDSREAKFYCKIHYAQRQTSSHMGRIRRLEERLHPRLLDSGSCSTVDSIQTGPPGETRVLEDFETVSATRDASCLVGANPTAKSQIQDSSKAHSNPKQNNRWKEKIRNTFPLIFIKYFQKNLTPDIDGPQTVPEVESSFEDIIAAEETTFADNLKSADGPSKRSLGCSVSAPRKRLMLSVSEKGKLLNWDAVVTTEESTNSPSNSEEQVHAETKADKSQTDSGQKGEPSESQSSASSPSAFQLIANAFRRTFNVTNPSSGSDSAVIMRTKCNSQHRQRPLSEGMLGCPEPCQGERNSGNQETWWATLGADAWGGGRDLPSLLQEVSLKGSRDSSLLFSDVTRQMPRRRINLFSSLRLRKPGASKSEGQHQEMQKESGMLLTNIRNDASCDPTSQEPSSGDDEEDKTVPSWKLHPERKRRKQEKMVARQARREQLKRLHRAQAIQRQLEEVTEKQRSLEERGVAIEKTIRREAGAESLESGDVVEDQLYRTWFKLVLEKNRLARYESELMIFAQELELEDTQSRLQQDLRQRMAIDDTKKSASELQEEQEILSEIMRTVEKRDTLVSLLEEQRLKERAEDRDLESLVLSKGYEFHWAQKDDG